MQSQRPTSPEPASAPVNPSGRIEAIDALRGLALFGVFAIHVTMQFRVSIFEQFLLPPATASALDRALLTFLMAAIEMKAFAVFSLLFGVGLAIQFERLAPNPRRAMLLVRRLAVLLTIGLIHLLLIWNGDILTEYSLAGFLVLPLLWGPRWLLAAGAALFLALYVAMPLLPPIISWPTTAWLRDHVAEARQVYGVGGLSDLGEDHRMAEELAALGRNAFVEKAPLIGGIGDEIDGRFVDCRNIAGAVAAMRAALHPKGDGGADGSVGARVEVGGFVRFRRRRGAEKLIGREAAGAANDFSTNQVHESGRVA